MQVEKRGLVSEAQKVSKWRLLYVKLSAQELMLLNCGVGEDS